MQPLQRLPRGQLKQALEEQRFDYQSAIRLLERRFEEEWRLRLEMEARFEEERGLRLEMKARLRVLESRR
jgi:hypothetical protein